LTLKVHVVDSKFEYELTSLSTVVDKDHCRLLISLLDSVLKNISAGESEMLIPKSSLAIQSWTI
jgi:hypothetical protein